MPQTPPRIARKVGIIPEIIAIETEKKIKKQKLFLRNAAQGKPYSRYRMKIAGAIDAFKLADGPANPSPVRCMAQCPGRIS